MSLRRPLGALIVLSVAGCATPPPGGNAAAAPAPLGATPAPAPDREYSAYVVSESADEIALVRFGPGGARVDHKLRTGMMPTEINGPHGVAVSPDGRWYFVSIGHGTPFGTLWKYATAGDSLVARVTLGHFPATVQVTPDGLYAFVANFNLHGEMVPSSVSVVDTDQMVEIARITTCVMPHGSRINPQGTKHYSACMMDDMLVEIDTRLFGVSRHFMLSRGREHGMPGAPGVHAAAGPAPSTATAAGGHEAHGAGVTCSPTWAQPSSDGRRVYVACNKANEILEIDVERWALMRRFPARNGVYNLAVTNDGRRLVATNKKDQSVSVFDLEGGTEVARIPTTRQIVHGVVVSPDDRYAFITVEGIGSQPGTVEIIDLRALATVATVDVGQQAAGIDFFRMEPVAPR